MKVAILGPGGVGGLIAGLLKRHDNEVFCVTSNSSAKLIAEKGLHITSKMFGDFIAKPKAVATLETKPDLMFVTVKSTMLKDAIAKAPSSVVGNAIVIPLLNGFEHLDILRNAYGDNVVAGNLSIEAMRSSPNEIKHTSPFVKIRIATNPNITKKQLEPIASTLKSAGIDTEIVEDEARLVWEKFVRLNALACTTSAADKSIGVIRSDPKWRELLKGCIADAVNVAAAYGYITTVETVLKQIDEFPESLGSSMQRDIAQGKKPELDSIPKSIIRAGEKKGIDCPTIKKLVNMIEKRIS